MTEWFDSHCHVDEEAFDEDREEALKRMAEHGITRYAVIGSDMETSRRAIRFAGEHSGAVAAGGIQQNVDGAISRQDIGQILLYDLFIKDVSGKEHSLPTSGLDSINQLHTNLLCPLQVQKNHLAALGGKVFYYGGTQHPAGAGHYHHFSFYVK